MEESNIPNTIESASDVTSSERRMSTSLMSQRNHAINPTTACEPPSINSDTSSGLSISHVYSEGPSLTPFDVTDSSLSKINITNSITSKQECSPSVPLDETIVNLSSAFEEALITVCDVVVTRICYLCSSPAKDGPGELKELMNNLHPEMKTALKECVFLKFAQNGDGHAVVHLLALGVNGDCVDRERRNALHLACINGYDNVVNVVIDFKAIHQRTGRVTSRPWCPRTNHHALDVYSKTPLDYAKENNNFCVYYLEKVIEYQDKKNKKKIKKK